jgi:hypothetical protein
MSEVFVKINPADPLRLSKEAVWRKRKWSDSSGNSFSRADDSRWACRNKWRLKSSYIRTEVSTDTDKNEIGSGRLRKSWW